LSTVDLKQLRYRNDIAKQEVCKTLQGWFDFDAILSVTNNVDKGCCSLQAELECPCTLVFRDDACKEQEHLPHRLALCVIRPLQVDVEQPEPYRVIQDSLAHMIAL